MIQIADTKVRGFWADSKELARFLTKLLRQGERFATEWGKEVELCRKEQKKEALDDVGCLVRCRFISRPYYIG